MFQNTDNANSFSETADGLLSAACDLLDNSTASTGRQKEIKRMGDIKIEWTMLQKFALASNQSPSEKANPGSFSSFDWLLVSLVSSKVSGRNIHPSLVTLRLA